MINQLKAMLPYRIRQPLELFLHRGDRYLCPFCLYSSRDLCLIGYDFPVLTEKQVIGAGRRPGGCHKCASSDRERLIYIYLREKMKFFSADKAKRILHFAPEEKLSKKIADFGFTDYVCGDLFAEGYRYAKHVQNINVLDIPYQDNSFDLIICNHVLEHIPADLLAMKELRRVLKKGGQAILLVPISKNSAKTFEDFSVTDPQQREIVFGQFDHLRIYGQDYAARLEESGFRVTRTNISKEFMNYGLNADEDIFIGTK